MTGAVQGATPPAAGQASERESTEIRTHTLALIVDNEPGLLARVIGLFSGRGYNIESLTVSEIDERDRISRITVVTSGTLAVLRQIKAQLERLVPVHRVWDLTELGAHVERELALVKLIAEGPQRREALRIADIYRVKVSDTTLNSFIFIVEGRRAKVNSFLELMARLGPVEIVRSGLVAMARGNQTHHT